MAYEKPFEKKNNSGSLFTNKKKEKDTHPDYRGDILLDGNEYWVSGWKKKDKNGDTFLSLAFSPKEAFGPPQKAGGLAVPSTPPPVVVNGKADDDPF